MYLVDDVAAGLILSAMLWILRRASRWWRRRSSRTDRPKDNLSMPTRSRPAVLPHHARKLCDYMDFLFAKARIGNRPITVKDLAIKLAGEPGLGRSSLYRARSNPHLAPKATVMEMSLALAECIEWGTRRDECDLVSSRVSHLWDMADRESSRPEREVEAIVRTLWASFGRREIVYLHEVTNEAAAAIAASRVTSVDVQGNEVTVHIFAPDGDTALFLDGHLDPTPGMWERALERLVMKWIGSVVDLRTVAWSGEPVADPTDLAVGRQDHLPTTGSKESWSTTSRDS